jgi:hypothetical protein
MAIKIQTYWKTTDATLDELRRAVKSCEDQDQRVLLLFKTYGTLSNEDLNDLYNYYWPPFKLETQKTSTSRSRKTLLESKIIIECGTTISHYNRTITLYTIVDNPPEIIKSQSFKQTIPDTIKIPFIVIDEKYVDFDLFWEDASKQVGYMMTKFNLEPKQKEEVVLPTNENELELYIHEKILEVNEDRRTNIGAVIGRYLADLREEGVLQSFDYKRDEDDRLKTIIKVTEPTQIPTVRQRLNQLYLKEKNTFNNKI